MPLDRNSRNTAGVQQQTFGNVVDDLLAAISHGEHQGISQWQQQIIIHTV
jgi:hypothetical protein